MRNAIGYVRVSSARQADDGISLDVQRQKITHYCELHQLRLLAIHADEGISGRKMDTRPALLRALDQASVHHAVLVTYKLDRLARSAADAERICERMEASGADLACVSDPIDTSTPMGRAFFAIVSVIARLESDVISERVTDCVRARWAELGFNPGGMQPFGYRLDKSNKDFRIVREPAEMAIVAEIIMHRQQGRSTREIADWLNATGTPTYSRLRGYRQHTGQTWNQGSVSMVLERHRPDLLERGFRTPHTWTDAERGLIGTMPDRQLAERLGVAKIIVYRERVRLAIPPYRKGRSR